MTIIGAHLNEFYLQYATDEGLSLPQTEQQVSQWDTDDFRTAIDQLLNGVNPDEKLTQQLQTAYVQANHTRRDMLNALIGAGMAVATYKAQEYGKQAITKEHNEGYHTRTGNQPLPPTEHPHHDEFTNRLWIHGDVARSRMQETLNNGLRRGLDNRSIRKLTHVYPVKSARKAENLASEMNKLVTRSQGLLIDQTTKANQDAQKQAFDDRKVEYCFLLTQNDDKVCAICDDLAGSIYPIDEAPVLPDDTHFGCRCQLIPCDVDGNILPGFTW